VTVKASADNPSTVAAGLVPVVVGIALWIGTLMMLLTRPPVPVGLSWAQASPARRVLFGLAPVVLVGLVQAALLLGLVAVAKVPIVSPLGLVLFTGLGTLAFAATNQALVSVFGGLGRLVSLAFALVEAAALGGLMPIETAPAAIQTLNGVLPLPQFVSGAAELLLGGHGSLATACLVLSIWTVLAIGASVLAAARRSSRVGDVQTSHPGPAPAPSTA
jgi:putative membrane protein